MKDNSSHNLGGFVVYVCPGCGRTIKWPDPCISAPNLICGCAGVERGLYYMVLAWPPSTEVHEGGRSDGKSSSLCRKVLVGASDAKSYDKGEVYSHLDSRLYGILNRARWENVGATPHETISLYNTVGVYTQEIATLHDKLSELLKVSQDVLRVWEQMIVRVDGIQKGSLSEEYLSLEAAIDYAKRGLGKA